MIFAGNSREISAALLLCIWHSVVACGLDAPGQRSSNTAPPNAPEQAAPKQPPPEQTQALIPSPVHASANSKQSDKPPRRFEFEPALGHWEEAWSRRLPFPVTLSADRLLIGLRSVGVTDRTRGRWLPGSHFRYSILSGYAGPDGTFAIPPIFPAALPFSEGLAAVMHPCTKKWGYIDPAGHIVLPFVYGAAGYFSEGLAAVQLVDQQDFHYIDPRGDTVVPRNYWAAGAFRGGRAAVARRNPKSGRVRWYLVNRRGRKVSGGTVPEIPQRFLPPSFDGFESEATARTTAIAKAIRHPFLDVAMPAGRSGIPTRHGQSPGPAYGLLLGDKVPDDGSTEYLNTDGEVVFRIPSDTACPIRAGFISVLVGNRWWVHDPTGRVLASGNLD